MKTTILFTAIAFLLFGTTALAQDLAKVAPNNVKVLLDNDKVRLLDVQLKAGDKIGMHSHPAGFIYGIMNGKTKTSFPDGKTSETEFKAGEARWTEAVTHANEALTDGHVLVFELKEPMKMEKKMEKK